MMLSASDGSPPRFETDTKEMKLKSSGFSALRSQGRLQVRIHRQLRMTVSLGLTVAIFLSSLALTVSAHTSNTPNSNNDYFVLYEGDNGDVVCRLANVSERTELDKISPKN